MPVDSTLEILRRQMALGNMMIELAAETKEQRTIIASLVGCVCDLKIAIDKLTEKK